MMNLDLTNVQEAGEFSRLQPGGYICKITRAEDIPDKMYLDIEFDITEGEHKNYYSDLAKARGFWGGHFIRSYKDNALPFFKAFVTAVENSNSRYKFNYDENTLFGKNIGIVLSEEEYRSNSGIKTRLYVSAVRSVDKIKSGDFKVLPLKTLSDNASTPTSVPQFTPIINDDDIPF